MSESPPCLTGPVITRMAARSFFICGLWNFERLQQAGFLFMLLPALRHLYPDPELRREAVRRHQDYFNTHPYLAGPMAGLVAGLEEDLAAATTTYLEPEEISALKRHMAPPLAALGDAFFWSAWRPFCSLVGVCLILSSRLGFVSGAAAVGWSPWWGVAAFLALFNLPHLVVRVGGVWAAYRMRGRTISLIRRLDAQRAIRVARLAGFGVLALAFLLAAARFLGQYRLL